MQHHMMTMQKTTEKTKTMGVMMGVILTLALEKALERTSSTVVVKLTLFPGERIAVIKRGLAWVELSALETEASSLKFNRTFPVLRTV